VGNRRFTFRVAGRSALSMGAVDRMVSVENGGNPVYPNPSNNKAT